MGGNVLTDVPATLGQLKYLQALVLCDNLIESLPSNIANLHNLKTLQLHKNRLRTLPPEIIALKNLNEVRINLFFYKLLCFANNQCFFLRIINCFSQILII